MKTAAIQSQAAAEPAPPVAMPARRDDRGSPVASRPHDFGGISIHADHKRTESIPGLEDDSADVKRAAGDAGVDAGSGAGGGSAAAASPTLSASGDDYSADTATESHKKIKFTVGVPSGQDVKDYGLVNWVKGSMKDGSGKFFKWTMYGNSVDANNSDFKVDSLDADPLYWSDASARWNYTATSGGFFATDDPGPALKTETGAVYALKFSMRLYKLADVPTTTSGTIAATALQSVDWQYSVKVSSTGAFSHPAL